MRVETVLGYRTFYLAATYNFTSGDRNSPLLPTLLRPHMDNGTACAACMLIKYCSRDCQIAHQPQHKQECKSRVMDTSDSCNKDGASKVDLSDAIDVSCCYHF